MDQKIFTPEFPDGYQANNQYSANPFTGGRMPFGVGSLLMQLFGNRMWPLLTPGTPESQYDAVWRRQKDMQMLGLGRKTVASWYPFQNLGGLNENSMMTQIATSLMSQPDGMVAKLMAPVLGGNPIQAQMSSFANLQGVAAAGLNTPFGTTVNQLIDAQQGFEKYFYVHDDVARNKKIGSAHREAILNMLGTGNTDVARVLGLNDQQIQGMFNPARNNEIAPGSTAHRKIFNADKVLTALDSQIGTSSIDELRKTVMGGDLGDMVDSISKTLNDSVAAGGQKFKELFSDATGKLGKPEEASTIQSLVKSINEAKTSGKSLSDIYNIIADTAKSTKLSDESVAAVKKALTEANKESADFTATKIADKTHQKDIRALANETSLIGKSMLMQNVTRGVDYQNSMGFNIEDLTGARNEFLKNRMFAGRLLDLTTISEKMAGRIDTPEQTSIPEVLNAARSYYGNNLSGKELAHEINNYVGFSNYDLDNPDDRQSLADNYRTTKAVARITNINLDSLKSLDAQARAMAASSPSTAHMGGREIGPMISEQAIRTVAMSAALGGNSVRFLGGTGQMLANRVQGTIESAQSLYGREFSGIHTLLKESGKLDSLKMLEEYVRSDKADHTVMGTNHFLQELAKRSNMSMDSMLQYSLNNVAAQQIGMNDMPELQELGKKTDVANFRQSLFATYGGKGGTGFSKVEAFDKALRDPNLDMTQLLVNPEFTNGELAKQLSDIVGSGALDTYAAASNPTYAKYYKELKDSINTSKDTEARVAKQMASMDVPTMERFIQGIASGDITGNKGIKTITDSIGISDQSSRYHEIVSSGDAIHKLMSTDGIKNMALAVGYKPELANALGVLGDANSKYGNITPENISKLAVEDFSDLSNRDKLTPKAGAELAQAARDFLKAKGHEDIQNFNPENFRAAEKKKLTDKMVDNLFAPVYDKESEALTAGLTKQYEATTKPEDKQWVKGLLDLGKPEEIFNALENLKNDPTGQYNITGDGDKKTYELSGYAAKLAKAAGFKTTTFSDEKSMKAAIASINNKVKVSESWLADVPEAHARHKAQEEKVKESAAVSDPLSGLVRQILDKLDKLNEIPTSIDKLTSVVNTK